MTSNEELLKEYKEATEERKEEIENILVENNINLVYSYLRKSKINLTEDVIQEGLVGVVTAIRNYNGKNKFSTYCYYWIKNKVLKHLKNNKLIRIPNHVNNKDVDFKYCTIEKASVEFEKDVEESHNIYKIIINDFKKTISKRDVEILDLYLQGLNYREISEKYGISSQRAIQVMQRIKKK